MKKFLALILASLLVVSFAACSKKEDENTNNNSNNTAAPSESTYNEFRYSFPPKSPVVRSRELPLMRSRVAPTSAPSRFLTR